MNKKIFMVLLLMIAVVAVSCGKKAEDTKTMEDTNTASSDISLPSFVYTSLADAKSAAEKSGKDMVLEFSTDW